MTWSDKHIWKVSFPREQIGEQFDFKFVIRDGDGIVRWEGGPNHKFNLTEYVKQFSQPAIYEALKEGGRA